MSLELRERVENGGPALARQGLPRIEVELVVNTQRGFKLKGFSDI